MKPLAPLDSAAFSELADLCRIDAMRPPSPYKPNGTFIKETRNGGADRYWYYRGYDRSFDGSPGRATKTFVGKADDEQVEADVARHAEAKASYATRRQIVARLKRAGLPAPHRLEGVVVEVLAETGFFEAGMTIVGSVAFQTYGGPLGMRFEQSHYRTLDLDLAQARGVKLHLGDVKAGDVLDVLRKADASFAPLFHTDEPQLVAGFRNAQQFRVEFLTPKVADRKGKSGFAPIAGLPGVGAQQLKFLEFSLKNTISTVMLHEAGLLVPTPDPARFAVHKLIVSALRSETNPENADKSFKDVLQAQSLIDGFAHIRDMARLGRTWLEAWATGPKWKKALREGTLRLGASHLSMLAAAIEEAAVLDGVASPFDGVDDPRSALLGRASAARGAG